MSLHHEDRPAGGDAESSPAEYQKPAIAWEQTIDVRRLSVGCTKTEVEESCTLTGTPSS